jgi:uncharacterized protein with NRDE domain
MCLLIVIAGLDPDYPILAAGNRDELRARPSAPPGLFVGERHRMLSPRDKLAGGTWMAVNDAGMFAGLTNLSAVPPREGAPTRGRLPHLALDHEDVDAAVAAVREAVAAGVDNAFQLVVSDGRSTAVLSYDRSALTEVRPVHPVVISNEHRLGELELPGLPAALAPGMTTEQRLEALRAILCDGAERDGHRVLKTGGVYGTVSSSLIAVHREDPRRLVWHYAPGPPDVTRYRSYGNLGRRLQ